MFTLVAYFGHRRIKTARYKHQERLKSWCGFQKKKEVKAQESPPKVKNSLSPLLLLFLMLFQDHFKWKKYTVKK